MSLATAIEAFLNQIPPGDLGIGPRGQELGSLVFTRPSLAVHFLLKRYTASQCLGLLEDLGLGPALQAGSSLEDLLRPLHSQARSPLAWMLDFLAAEGLLEPSGGVYRRTPLQPDDPEEIRALAEQEAPGHAPAFALLDAVRRQIPPFFLDGRSGDQLLFDLSFFPLWLDYFRNENLVYQCNNLYTLAALQENLQPGTRLLELGGGAGSFAQMLSQDGAEHGYLGRIAEYRFTDVAPTFLRRAQRGLAELAPGLPFRFGLLDLNRPLSEQGMAEERFDVILGVNVLHVARNLPWTLAMLKAHLAPGGRLIVGECLKPDLDKPIYIEWLFQFVSSFTGVDLDPDLRPAAGFLTPEAWMKLLTHAGYTGIRQVPEARRLMDQYPAFYVGAFEGRAAD